MRRGGRGPRDSALVQRGWSPSEGPAPEDGDHGSYRLLEESKLELTSADPDVNRYRVVFGYRVAGQALRLRLLDSTNPGVPREQLRLENALHVALAAAPLKRVAGAPATAAPPANAAAGGTGRLVYVEESSDGMQLVTVNGDGSGRTELDQLGAPEVANPDWSADGKRLVYEISDEQHAGVVRAKSDSGKARDLTPQGFQGQPAFTPDGKSIVFEREAGGNGVWIMRADGSRAGRLTATPSRTPTAAAATPIRTCLPTAARSPSCASRSTRRRPPCSRCASTDRTSGS